MMGLTHRQRELLDFIGAYMATEKVAPSFAEMMDGIGSSSKSTVFHLLGQLEERGFINRLRGRDRAIVILETPRPVLSTVKARPLLREDTDTLIAEIEARGFHVERKAA